MRYVIIGGGIAGTTAAEELRKADPEAEITLVSEEHHPIYSRVLLPHYIKSKVPRERVFLKKLEWYSEQNIEWLAGVTVDELDPKNKFVRLSTGREVEYDKVLIATGGDVRTIGEDKRGISYFRTLDDADHMLQLLAERNPEDRGVVFGGGFLACEYLNIFEKFEVPTTIAFRGDYFWSSIFTPESGELVNDHLKSKGVEVLPGASDFETKGEKALECIVACGKTIDCSIAGIGIGMVRDTSWIEAAGVEFGRGIKANEFLETNVEDVFTAGDCAEFFDPITKRHLYVGNWMNAMMQGRVVAKNMMGTKTPFELVSSYATNALGLEMIFVGDTEKGAADQVVIRGSKEEGGVTQLFVRNGVLVGGTMVNRNTDRTPVTNLIKSGKNIEEYLEFWKDSSVPITVSE